MNLIDPSFRYTWLMWAAAFMLHWALLFIGRAALRRPMLWGSALTAPFGLTEPLFVPTYWNPPSLFDLAQRTGFDVESLNFCYAIGGLGVAGYRALAPVPPGRLNQHARSSPRHRWHLLALASPFFVFTALLALRWNPIYPGDSRDVPGRGNHSSVPPGPLPQHTGRWRRLFDSVCSVLAGTEVALARIHRGSVEPRRFARLAAGRFACRGDTVRLRIRHVLEQRVRARHVATERRGEASAPHRPRKVFTMNNSWLSMTDEHLNAAFADLLPGHAKARVVVSHTWLNLRAGVRRHLDEGRDLTCFSGLNNRGGRLLASAAG